MNLADMLDGTTAAIVLGGTLLGTLLRCGLGDVGDTFSSLGRALGKRSAYNGDQVRARMARVVRDIQQDGLLRSDPLPTGDADFDAALHALVGKRSVAAFKAVLAEQRRLRLAPAEAAIRTLLQAAELAPVFGLAGTLLSLSKMPSDGIDRSAYMVAIGMAVHATLYGLMAANLLLAPLARLIERRARTEEVDRQALIDWVEYELADAFMVRHDRRHHEQPAPVPAEYHHEVEGPKAGEVYDIMMQRAGNAA